MILTIYPASFKERKSYSEAFGRGDYYPDAMTYIEHGFLLDDCSGLDTIKPIDGSPVAYRNGEYDDHPKTRSCTVRWAYNGSSPLVTGLLERVTKKVREINEIYRMEIEGAIIRNRNGGANNGFMVADYVKDDWFQAHRDIGTIESMSRRKLSVVIQLTDPNTYEGGDLWISSGFGMIKAPREKGTLIAFPSYQFHQVDRMVRGSRRSLVFWFEGREPFR